MTNKLTREKVQWLHEASEEAATAGIKLTMNPNELLMFTGALLAAMDSEPVAYMHHSGQVITREECCDDKLFAICCKVETPLYRHAQPAPAVPYIFGYVLCNHGTPDTDFVFADRDSAEGTAEHLNDTDTHDLWTVEPICRAAMLQGKAEPVSNRDELLPSIKPAPELDFVAENAKSLPRNPPSKCSLRDGIEAIRNSGIPVDVDKIQSECEAGNSPVIPDGWQLVPVELTPDMRAAWDLAPNTDDDDHNMQAAYRAMIAAAPQQEVK